MAYIHFYERAYTGAFWWIRGHGVESVYAQHHRPQTCSEFLYTRDTKRGTQTP